jgi:hypothetical protein
MIWARTAEPTPPGARPPGKTHGGVAAGRGAAEVGSGIPASQRGIKSTSELG